MDRQTALTIAMKALGFGGAPPGQRLSGSGGGPAPGGPNIDLGVVCFEDGTCIPGSGKTVGTRQDPNGTRGPDNPHRTYADGTGGRFYVPPRLTQTVTPTRDPNQPHNPQAGMDFAALLDLFRNRRR